MATTVKNTKKAALGAPITLPVRFQVAVIGMLMLAWIGSAGMMLSSFISAQSTGYGWTYLSMTLLFPLVLFAVALVYAWKQYKDLLQRLFVSVVLATSGYAATQILLSVLFVLNARFNVLTVDTESMTGVYILEWGSMLFCLAAYVLVIGIIAGRNKVKK